MSPAPTLTHCPYCSLQCGISMVAGDRPATLQPQPDFPTNLGGLCSKGWNANSLLDHPQRLLTPLVRTVRGDRNSPFRAAGWDEALDQVVDGITSSQRRYGLDSVGCFGGGGLTNEKAYAFGKFARVALRTSAIDYNGRFCMSSAATACNRALGVDRGLPFPLADIAGAKAILLVGSNPAATMPPAMQFFDAGRANGAVHIVVDPRRSATAAGSTVHLQPLPGTDLALANGLLHIAIKEGYVDTDYIAARTKGYAAVKAGVAAYWPDRTERITGIAVEQLRQTVQALATAPSAMILTARGAEQHSNGTDTAQAFLNLALALGLPGKPYSGYGTITGQGNGQGGREHGQKADQLPGYRKLADPADRAHVAKVWGIAPEELPQPGLSAFEMLDKLGSPGGVRALLVLASNLVVSAPDANRVADRLRGLDLLVVSDIFLAETAEFADVVLPTAQWAEEEGTMTNLEGRVIRRRRALPPPAGVWTDLELIKALADRLGRGQYFSAEPREVFEELRRASAGGIADYSGISYERIEAEKGVFWPCPSPTHPGTPRLFAESFPTPDGRASFIRVEHRDPVEVPDADFPYVLTTGRLMAQYQSGAQTRRHRSTAQTQVQPEAQIHPDLARRLDITGADIVQLRTRRGTANFRARLTEDIRSDTIFVPFHWGGASNANVLTSPALDRHSKMPAFKACAVSLEWIGSPDDAHLLATPPKHTEHSAPTRPTLNQLLQPSRRKDRPMMTKNLFLQGIYPFEGAGLDKPVPISPELVHVVPDGVINQTLYFRGGNSSAELITAVLMRDGVPMRYFPIGAKSDVHVPLRVVEDIEGGSVIELHLVAQVGVSGSVVVDLGMVEH
ncbi:MAG: assimilatory nitrate reductase catalytic subunit [Propionibacteriaceae bacterium]|nr:assimilatory nitrate reductase catalytic subunit [Propionibacteriaceae bacterium]